MSSSELPLLFSASGPTATPPLTLYSALVTQVAASVPDYTANLPGSLIDDVAGTQVGGLAMYDQARVDAVQSVSPVTANPYVLAQQGQQFGIPLAGESNGNALEVFSGTPGYLIYQGFIVGDGTNQYVVQDGVTIGTGGTSPPTEVIATSPNVFPIPAGAINQIITSVPGGITLTCTNPEAGVPGTGAPQTIESYRATIVQAYQFQLQGAPSVIRTLLLQVPGVSSRLISILSNGTKWEVVVGGGDPYQVAAAIYQGVSTPGLLVGSSTTPRNITETIIDGNDSFDVVFVNPPQQEVTWAITWNTTLTGFTAAAAVNQFIIQTVQAYTNGIIVGQPINLLVVTEQIQEAISSVLAPVNLTTLIFVVKYSGTTQSPTAGTSIIPAPDNETSLYSGPSDVTAAQG